MPDLDFATEIAAFIAIRPKVRLEHGPSWVVIVGSELQGVYPDYERAIEDAISRFPNTPFLIRNTEETPPHIPLVVVEAV